MTRPPGEGLRAAIDVRVRPMASGDVDAAHAVLKECPEASIWSKEDLLASASGGIALVAELDGSFAGILIGRLAADELEIQNLAVGRAWRHRGAATHLVMDAVARACSAGAKQIYLEVRASNEAAIALYTRLGFRECGRRPGYYREPLEDAVLFVFHNEQQKV
jgi:[ribosomal protein S18]-alanine N-acetyltransferase